MKQLSTSAHNRFQNESVSTVIELIKSLKRAIKIAKYSDFENVVNEITSAFYDPSLNLLSTKRYERELFVSLGGFDLLMHCLDRKPFGCSDFRQQSKATIERRSSFWNEILVILRMDRDDVPVS